MSTSSVSTARTHGQETISSASQASPRQFEQSSNHSALQAMPPPSTLPYGGSGQLWSFENDYASAFASPFQDIFFSSLDNFSVGLDFANSDVFLGPEHNSNPHGSSTSPKNDVYVAHGHWTTKEANNYEERCKALVEHFVKSANPVSVILPITSEWTSACRSLLAMANESSFLLSAICALSALHIHITKGDDHFDEAFQNYKISSRDVTAILDDPNVEDRQLRQAFATIFLLSHVEVS